jgi:hypothetical protein
MATTYRILEYRPATASDAEHGIGNVDHDAPILGAGCVLKWSAAIVTLGIAAITLLCFAYQLSAEQALARAVGIGLRAAAMPRATSRTVEQSIRRELGNGSQLSQAAHIWIERAGKPFKGAIASDNRHKIAVTIAAPTASVLPSWLLPLSWWPRDAWIRARVE